MTSKRGSKEVLKMKKKTTNIIIGMIAAVVVVAAVCIIAFSGGEAPEVPSDPTETSTADVTVCLLYTS